MALQKKLQEEVRDVTTRLGNIIREQAGDEAFDAVQTILNASKIVRDHHKPEDIEAKHKFISSLDLETAYSVIHGFSLFFQVVNVCEERARRRAVESRDDLRQSLGVLFKNLKAKGVTTEKMQECVDQMEIEPVLTAHPTESKRRTVQTHLIRLEEHLGIADEILEALWQTRETRNRRMSPLNEVQNCLFYFERTIFKSIATYMAHFRRELKDAYPDVKLNRPFLKFGSWVGGDRDGNPYVTPEITLKAMALQHELAVRLVRQELEYLLAELSHATSVSVDDFEQDDTDSPFHVDEKIRRKIEDLLEIVVPGYTDADHVIGELKKIQKQLIDQNAKRAADGRIAGLIIQLESSGFYLAHLDIRDHSSKLQNAREDILEEFRTIKKVQETYGEHAAHRFILSMTHSADVLIDLLKCAKEAGCEKVDLVPLFETVDDLANAPELLKKLLEHEDYRKHLKSRGNIQEVMLGYSDSSKDGSYITANWNLYNAQRKISEFADSQGVCLRLFHGKGGTIDRGGGVTYRSLMAQPHAAHGGRIRITEQGEVISLKYANPVIARRNLEQLTTGIMEAFCYDEEAFEVKDQWAETMDVLSEVSRGAFRELVYETPEFQEYYWQATPIDFVAELKIGSRPASRSNNKEMDNLRAIPWVFSWTQSRHMLSAWYGMGGALEAAMNQEGGLERLKDMYENWPFFSMVLDNAEISLAKADLYIASRYASLVENEKVRDMIFGKIESEYRKSVKMVTAITGHDELLGNFPRLAESIRLRNPYVDPLHYLQVRLLGDWRKEEDETKKEFLSRLLALTVNGISFGMKSTG